MQNATRMGLNRTGAQMSPAGVEDMIHATTEFPPDTPADDGEATALRGSYIGEADEIGSVPLPGTIKGALKSGAAKLTGNKPEVLIDKLGERLAFERTGTRLYEALIVKCEAANADGESIPPKDTLLEFCREEASHFKLVASALESLGADPTAQTPGADVTGVASMGVMQVLTDPRTTVAQCLDAILTAELTDNAGWELLIKLAQNAGQDQLANDFRTALEHEQHHLETVRGWLEQSVLRENA